MTGLASAAQVHALSQGTEWSLALERAGSDVAFAHNSIQNPCLQGVLWFMQSASTL